MITWDFVLAVLTNAAPFALCAIGMQLMYLPTRAVNFAQGDLMVLGATIFAVSAKDWFPSQWLIAVLVSLLAAFLVALLAKPLFTRSESRIWGASGVTLFCIGLSLLVSATSYWIGREQNFALRIESIAQVEPLRILSRYGDDATEGLSLLSSLAGAILISAMMQFTRLSKRLDAIGVGRNAFALWEQSSSWGTRGVYAGLFLGCASGILIAPLNYADPHVGITYGFRGFAILLLSQLAWGTPFAVCLGALALAFLEQLLLAYMPRLVADLVPATLVIFLSLWFFGGLQRPKARGSWRLFSSRRLFERLADEEYEKEHFPRQTIALDTLWSPVFRSGRILAEVLPHPKALTWNRTSLIISGAARFLSTGTIACCRLLGITGILAIAITIWTIARVLSGDSGAFQVLLSVAVLSTMLPLQWILQRWLNETWLCVGALAMVGGYTYALASETSLIVAIMLASTSTAFVALLVLCCTAYLRKTTIPLVTITIHLATISLIIHNKAMRGAEGMHNLVSPFPVKAGAMMLIIVLIPSILGAVFVSAMSNRAIGRRLKVMGRDPVLFATMGGHRLRTSVIPVAICAMLLGIASALGVSINRSCAPGSFLVSMSLFPVIAVAMSEKHYPLIAPFVLAAPVMLSYIVSNNPVLSKMAIALFVLVTLVSTLHKSNLR